MNCLRWTGCRLRRRDLVPVILSLAVPLSGCEALGPPAGGNGPPALPDGFEDGNQDPGVTSPLGKTRGEPNDSFLDAIVAVYDRAGTARLQGTIASEGDFDVYALGLMEPGDLVTISTTTQDSPLDISIAVFDDQERLFITNDDMETGSLDAFVLETIRHAGDPYYLVISASALAVMAEQRTGAYQALVTVARGGDVPPPQGQILLLDFDGGTVSALTIPVSEVSPFRAGDIAPMYAGQTEVIKQAIIETVRENFEGLDVTIVTSDDDELPPEGTYSTVLFGGSNLNAFGISEHVDTYNRDSEDVAVIFTESFRPRLFSRPPTADEMGVAIGNIGSHEAGHLLGLNHVRDATAVMDEVNPADTFLEDQEFKEAPLSPTIAPLGVQDALLLLQEILGIT